MAGWKFGLRQVLVFEAGVQRTSRHKLLKLANEEMMGLPRGFMNDEAVCLGQTPRNSKAC